jgi:hypothetical protein
VIVETSVEGFKQKAQEYGYKMVGWKWTLSSFTRDKYNLLIPLEIESGMAGYYPNGFLHLYIFIVKIEDSANSLGIILSEGVIDIDRIHPPLLATFRCIMPEDSITSLDEYFNYLQFFEVTE